MKNNKNTFLSLLEQFINSYLPISKGLSPNTIISYKCAFRQLFQFMYDVKGIKANNVTFECLNYEILTEFFNWIGIERQCSNSTKIQRLAALSSFATYAQNRDFDSAIIYKNSIGKITFKTNPNKPRAVFTREEVSILLSLPNMNKKTDYRNLVLLSIMYASGARAQEICDLKVKNIIYDCEKTYLIITGKGRKTRRISIPETCAILLKQYIEYRKIDSSPNKYIFSSQTHEHMTVSCIEEIFKKYITIAKKQNPHLFLEKSYTPHSMRHTTATHMLNAGVPLVVLKNFLGHESLQSTMIYAQISQTTIDKYIIDWNNKWFMSNIQKELTPKEDDRFVDFLL